MGGHASPSRRLPRTGLDESQESIDLTPSQSLGKGVRGGSVKVPRLAHCIWCFWKNSHMRSLAEMFLADLPMKPTGGC